MLTHHDNIIWDFMTFQMWRSVAMTMVNKSLYCTVYCEHEMQTKASLNIYLWWNQGHVQRPTKAEIKVPWILNLTNKQTILIKHIDFKLINSELRLADFLYNSSVLVVRRLLFTFNKVSIRVNSSLIELRLNSDADVVYIIRWLELIAGNTGR